MANGPWDANFWFPHVQLKKNSLKTLQVGQTGCAGGGRNVESSADPQLNTKHHVKISVFNNHPDPGQELQSHNKMEVHVDGVLTGSVNMNTVACHPTDSDLGEGFSVPIYIATGLSGYEVADAEIENISYT